MNFDFLDRPRILYACDQCCTKLTKKGELCWRCHRGHGEQIDPVPKKEAVESINLCAGVSRRRKRRRTNEKD